MTFAADLARFVEKAGRNADAVVRNVTLEAANSVIEMSPVGAPETWKSPPPPGYVGGRFRANWQHGSGSPLAGQVDAIDESGEPTKGKIRGSVADVKAGGIEYITNNLPYAASLEYGSSQQAPQGMVRVTAARFRELLARAARGVR